MRNIKGLLFTSPTYRHECYLALCEDWVIFGTNLVFNVYLKKMDETFNKDSIQLSNIEFEMKKVSKIRPGGVRSTVHMVFCVAESGRFLSTLSFRIQNYLNCKTMTEVCNIYLCIDCTYMSRYLYIEYI